VAPQLLEMGSVTTPLGSKPGASGLTLVCRPTPIVRFMHTSELALKQLVYRMAHRTLVTLLLLLTGTIYRGTPKQYSLVRVQKNYSHILFLHEKSGNVLPAGSAAFIPMPESLILTHI
jgi:hypothetical protein